jgi:hypothetical protein
MRVIGEPLTALERAAFLRCVRSYINVPFGHQGRKPWKLDCAGLLLVSMQGFARNVPFTDDRVGAFVREWGGRPTVDLEAYGRTPFKDGLQRVLEDNAGPAVEGPPVAGDVVLMRFRGDPQHVGVITNHPEGGLRLVHTDSAVAGYASLGRVTEHRFDAKWSSHVFAVHRP